MKKPGVSKSKKGAIFNILWLLVENPRNLDYFRLLDIKEQLIEEFSIHLDRKTIQDYLDILIDLNLPFEVSHKYKKGYYVTKRMISDTERNILLHSLNSQKAINLETRTNLFNYITFDCSKDNKSNYLKSDNYSNLDLYNDTHFSLVENLEIIQRAIDEKRSITFEYLNYNSYGELMSDSRRYEVIPQKIKYIYGMYYLYNADNFWSNIYCGTKIKYMRNIQLGDYHNNPKLHEKFDYSFEIQIIYDWSIELIVDHFEDYKLIRDKKTMKAIIYTPYEYALEWCKKYAQFFIIKDEEIKDAIRNDMYKLLKNIDDKDTVILKIKSAIVDYHYKNPITDKSTYELYMKNLYDYIDFYLGNIGYKVVKNEYYKTYSNGLDSMEIAYLECCKSNLNYKEDLLIAQFTNTYNSLNNIESARRIMVILYDDFSEKNKSTIKQILQMDPFVDINDRFSYCNEAYFYKYLVFEI